MAESYNRITEYKIGAKTAAPLHIGSGEGDLSEVMVHPLTDLPFIQASGIAGALRNVSERINGKDTTERLFGSSLIGKNDTLEDSASRIRVTDAFFSEKSLCMEFRPRVSLDPFSGTVSEGNVGGSGRQAGHKFEIELIGSGAEFSFILYLYHRQDDGLREALERILAALANNQVQFGGQKSNGGGFVGVQSIRRKSFNMESSEDRAAWREEAYGSSDGMGETIAWGEDILKSLPEVEDRMFAFRFRLKGKTEGSLLVKGIEVAEIGKNKDVSVNIKNSEGAYIIPGSSLKGALRNRARILLDLLGKDTLLSDVFGETGKQSSGGKRGQAVVKDVIIGKNGEQVREVLQNRIHIDKFTGGVIDTGLFAEKAIGGVLEIEIGIYPGKNVAAAAGLIILTLRDLAAGAFNLGSGYNIGRGFITVESLQVFGAKDAFPKENEEKAAAEAGLKAGINFKDGSISDNEQLISRCLKALNDWEEQ